MNKFRILSVAFVMILGLGINTFSHAQQTTVVIKNPVIPAATHAIATTPAKNYEAVNPVIMVSNPKPYLNKNVKFKARFDKYSTLGLDYKPAFRSSEKFITFLIQRGDVTSHNVPLSELKIFLDRKEAEKHIDLNSGDEIEVAGHVFSNALGDVWMDAEKFIVISTQAKTDK
ncbi:MAG: hypothetical protein KH301_03635 [Brachyspira sp.]|nr:hypothetical protein [Brachyspira sp.]